jgi:hypothetical protein
MITIAEYENNTLHYSNSSVNFSLVHGLANAPANFVTRSYEIPENTVEMTWDPFTVADLKGLEFDHYEVSYNDNPWENVGSNLTASFSGLERKFEDGLKKVIKNTYNMYKLYNINGYTFYVRVITKHPDNENLFDGVSSQSANIPVSKPEQLNSFPDPNFLNSVKVEKTLNGTTGSTYVTLPPIAGLMYMKLPWPIFGVNLTNSSYTPTFSNPDLYNELFFYEDYWLAYEISKDGGVTWINPISNDNSYGTTNANFGATHVWGSGSTTYTLDSFTTDNDNIYNSPLSVTDIIYTPNGSIVVGQQYQFCVRRVGYNLFNPDPDRPIYSDTSVIILNTSYVVNPQERIYYDINKEYYANPLLNVTSTPSNNKITLNWDAANASVLGGLSLNYYEVQLGEGGSWEKVSDDTTITNYEFTPLINGTEYKVSVRTNCSHSERDASGTIITKIYKGEPVSLNNVPYIIADAPTNLIVSYPGSQNIKIVWDAVPVGGLGGLSLKNYEVSNDDGNTWIPVVSNDRQHTFTGLTNGNSYDIKVRATTKYNDINFSSVVLFNFSDIKGTIETISAIPRDSVFAPTLVNTIQGDENLRLTWAYYAETPGLLSFSTFKGGVDSNIIDLINNSSTTYVNNNNNTYTYTFNELTNGVKYILTVIPVIVISSTSEVIEGQPLSTRQVVPYVKASVPTNLITTPSDRQIKLEWSPVAHLGGLSLQRYEVSKDNGANWTPVAPNNREFIFTNLNNGTPYNIKVRAVTQFIDPNPLISFEDILGDSADISSIPFVKPGTVSNIVTSVTNNFFTFSFTPPTRVNNNNTFTQYYEYSIDNGNNWVPIILSAPWPNISVGDDIFSCKFRVYILNPNNNEIIVNGDIITINNLKNINITTVENLKATVGDGFVTLSWNSVPTMSYEVIQYGSSSNISFRTSNNSYQITGLDNGTEYRFGVIMYASTSPGPAANISARPISGPMITSVSKIGNFLNVYVNYGGSSEVGIVANSSYAVASEGTMLLDTSSTVSTSLNNISSNPISFQIDGITPDDSFIRNYFTIVVTNSVGNFSGIFQV